MNCGAFNVCIRTLLKFRDVKSAADFSAPFNFAYFESKSLTGPDDH